MRVCSFAAWAYRFSESTRHFSSINMQSTLQKTLPVTLPISQLRKWRYSTQRGERLGCGHTKSVSICSTTLPASIIPPRFLNQRRRKMQRNFPSLLSSKTWISGDKRKERSESFTFGHLQIPSAWHSCSLSLHVHAAGNPGGNNREPQCNPVTSTFALLLPFAKKRCRVFSWERWAPP